MKTLLILALGMFMFISCSFEPEQKADPPNIYALTDDGAVQMTLYDQTTYQEGRILVLMSEAQISEYRIAKEKAAAFNHYFNDGLAFVHGDTDYFNGDQQPTMIRYRPNLPDSIDILQLE